VSRDFEQYFKNFLELPFERILERYRLQKVLELIDSEHVGNVGKILEVGPALSPVFDKLDEYELIHILEPIYKCYQMNLQKTKERNSLHIFNLTLEDFLDSPQRCSEYDLILLSSVLHEMPNYRKALKSCHSLLAKDGKILIVVPNNESIHRLIGARNGIHPIGEKLTINELLMQQRISFSVKTAKHNFEKHGFKTIFMKTEFIKIFSNSDMQDLLNQGILNEDIINIFSKISSLLPNVGAEIFYLGQKI
jgi:hypothetical protein